jgi:crossover junction endodeoxyribonuclease RusA
VTGHPPCDRIIVAFELPSRPHPKGRPRFGRGRAYTDEKTRLYEANVATACGLAMIRDRVQIATGPVELACLFEQRDARAADVTNLVKAVEDAMNGIAWKDDKQVSKVSAVRVLRADVDRVSVAVLEVAS